VFEGNQKFVKIFRNPVSGGWGAEEEVEEEERRRQGSGGGSSSRKQRQCSFHVDIELRRVSPHTVK
jgi:hypothetical protein